MDTEVLVGDRIQDGQKLLGELVRDGFDVAVALWVCTTEEELGFLYIGSKSVGPETLGDGYRKLYACLSRIPDASVGISDVKLVPVSNPIAKDAIAVRDRQPGRIPIRYRGKRLGNLAIEEAYIYPSILGPMTPTEVLQTVVALMNRTGSIQPSLVTLRDGSIIHAIPVGMHMKQPGAVQVTRQDVATQTDRVVDVADILNIQ